MPTAPDVIITRRPTGNVTAEGGDDLAFTLLKRAGFVIETAPNSVWYRLPWDMGKDHENGMASHATRMLTAVGYHVDLDASLDVTRVTTPTDLHGQRVHGHRILQLTDELRGTRSYDSSADLIEHVLDPNDGVLVRLSEFFETAALRATASDIEDVWELSQRFEDAASMLHDLGNDLDGAEAQMQALGRRPVRPSWQGQVADYYAAAPAARRPGAPSVMPEEPPPVPPTSLKPSRSR